MTCGHLFNGISGFGLAAHWMGWSNIMHCEIDPYCNQVMNYHFPKSHQHEDIRATDFTIWRGKINILTGGFPCQPYSIAGKRKGKEDDRHLWPEMLRAIREIQPCWIVGENVRGLTNWNGGLVFDKVQSDLEAEGYKVIPFLLPAASVNAPHRRDRIWFIAYSAYNGHKRKNGFEQDRCKKGQVKSAEQWEEWDDKNRKRIRCDIGGIVTERFVTDAAGVGVGLERTIYNGYCQKASAGIIERGEIIGGNDKTDWSNFPTQSPICAGNDGLPGGLADITVPSKKYGTRLLKGKQAYGWWRKESLKALGNAIVPQVAFQIFKAIEQYNHL